MSVASWQTSGYSREVSAGGKGSVCSIVNTSAFSMGEQGVSIVYVEMLPNVSEEAGALTVQLRAVTANALAFCITDGGMQGDVSRYAFGVVMAMALLQRVLRAGPRHEPPSFFRVELCPGRQRTLRIRSSSTFMRVHHMIAAPPKVPLLNTNQSAYLTR